MRKRRMLVAFLWTFVLTACTANDLSPSDPLPDVSLARRPTGATELSLLVVGDFGVGGERQERVARAMQEWAARNPVDAFVTTGDNIYPRGHPSAFDDAWHDPFGWVERAGIPIVASLGNHDAQTAGGREVMELLDMPARWYAKRFGDVQLLVLDSNRVSDPAQLAFIATEADPEARWTIAVFHVPPFSCGRHGSSHGLRRLWLPLFEQRGVDLLLNGHDHSYQRFQTDPAAVVTGGGGASLTRIGDCDRATPKPAASFSAHHFVALDVGEDGIRVRAIHVPGSAVADDFVVR